LVSGSRLVSRALVASDGTKAPLPPLSAHAWHDTTYDQDCTFTLASDAMARCLPDAASGSIWFSDATCSVGPVYVQAAISPTPPPMPLFAAQSAPAQDGGAAAAYAQIGQATTAPANAYELTAGGCVPIAGGADPTNHYWTVTLLAATAFVAGSIQ